MAASCVELGFVEEVDNTVRLSSPFFPSKIGGKPAWLARSNLPDSKLLLCQCCEKPLIFLLQVYVPSDNEDSTFHRTIFVFCCRDGACYKANSNKCFAAFRCQLPRANEFYDPDVTEDQDKHYCKFLERECKMNNKWSPLCEICGCAGNKQCGKCHLARYCSKNHQTIDWKRGHKLACKMAMNENTKAHLLSEKSSFPLFPEYEIVTEPEEIDEDKLDNADKKNMGAYQKFIQENADFESSTVSKKEWELLAAESKKISNIVKDKKYWEFKKRISNDPDQVLRYQRNGEPLWISEFNILETSDVPKCPCGANRTFEFQILPQLLNYLKVDSLEASVDWGTVVLYTCSQDCNTQTVYNEEFVWKQDFSEKGLPAEILSKHME